MIIYSIINRFEKYSDGSSLIDPLRVNETESPNFSYKSLDSEHCLAYYICVVSTEFIYIPSSYVMESKYNILLLNIDHV